MDLYTLDRSYLRQDLIEEFDSLIWTERYYGDSECEVVVPLQRDLVGQLAAGTFLSIDQSKEPMIIENFEITEEGKVKVTGISVLSWLNNRFVRNSVDHRKTQWKITSQKPGEILWTIVKQMCTANSSIIGTNKMGLGSAAREIELIIPGLKLDAQDTSGKNIKKTLVPFGPVYDALRKIAEQYHIGMQIWLKDDFTLRFRSYAGLDRTSRQTKNEIVRFSSLMDSLAKVHELRSVADFTTLVYSYASSLEKIDTADPNSDPDTWLQQDNKPGIARRTPQTGKYTGFDLRARLLLCDDIKIKNDLDEEDKNGPEDTVPLKRAELLDVLDNRADKELKQHLYVRTIDGEVAPTNLFQYGRDYALGDIIEVQGNTNLVEISRVTEYIRSQDSNGEQAYPTVVAIDP
jgi:Siphovirus ReqiPepy6 Gp37-like protein